MTKQERSDLLRHLDRLSQLSVTVEDAVKQYLDINADKESSSAYAKTQKIRALIQRAPITARKHRVDCKVEFL
jgi:hypothetical protein